MAEKRFGCQDPTNFIVLPYKKTLGKEAVEIYRSTGREPQPWQEAMIYDILAINEDNLFVHTKYGYSVPRRNGKGEILTMRELFGLMRGEKMLHTAHRTTTSSSASLRLANLLKDMGYTEVQRVSGDQEYEKSYSYSKQFGLERIKILGTGKSGQVDFRTRTSKGGLGEGFDLLIVDEAQEYTDDQQSSLQYVVSDSENPQILLCGTPPTVVSSGTVFQKLRTQCLAGETEDTGWSEWSVPTTSDVNDVELWYQCNPAMGWQLNERKIKAEDKTDEIDFNIQRLGLWLRYNQKSAITQADWDELKCESLPELQHHLFVGVKYGSTDRNVSMSIAAKTEDGRIFVEGYDCQPIKAGNGWLIDTLVKMRPQSIVVDGANGQQLLIEQLKERGIKNAFAPTVKDVVAAHALFEQKLFCGEICHCGQPSLAQSVTNCEHRAIGSGGGFGYRSLKDGIEVGLLESTVLAHWLCAKSKERKKQKIIY